MTKRKSTEIEQRKINVTKAKRNGGRRRNDVGEKAASSGGVKSVKKIDKRSNNIVISMASSSYTYSADLPTSTQRINAARSYRVRALVLHGASAGCWLRLFVVFYLACIVALNGRQRGRRRA